MLLVIDERMDIPLAAYQTEAGDDCSAWEATGLDATQVLGATPLVGTSGVAAVGREEGQFAEAGLLGQHTQLDGVASNDRESLAFFQVQCRTGERWCPIGVRCCWRDIIIVHSTRHLPVARGRVNKQGRLILMCYVPLT